MTNVIENLTNEEVSKENIIMKGERLIPNEPNAKLLISALQYIGYDDISAIADIVDNCIDAYANVIKIYIDKDDNKNIRITIVDNGNGMDQETLDQALKLGSDTSHDDISDLGKYGMGLSTAGLALANKTIVLTRMKNQELLKSMTDVNIVKEKNAFLKTLEIANEVEEAYFNELVQNDSGTIVILEECVGVKLSEASTLKEKVIKNLARIFRNFMSKITFYVNDIEVKADDPLRLNCDELKGDLFCEEEYEVKWRDKDHEEQKGIIKVKISILPDCDSTISRKFGINQPNQGFSILRNNREIAYGYMPRWEGLTKHNDMNRLRGEISFSSDMDEAMGVNFRKNGIDMVDSIDRTLRAELFPQIKTIRDRNRKKVEVTEEIRETHGDAEKIINKMSKVLMLPKVEKEVRDGGKHINENDEDKAKSEGDRNRAPQKTENISAIAKFELESGGATADIYRFEKVGRKIIIYWNVDHVFYQKFMAENSENENVIKIADYLIYTFASAQILWMADGDDRYDIINSIITTMSTNMRNLLS